MLRIPSLLLLALAVVRPSTAANCSGNDGGAGGECVYYYASSCDDSNALGSYKPTCEGNCFRYSSFSAIGVSGDKWKGTNCVAFSDDNCQNAIGSTGNELDTSCTDFNKQANSMQCYFGC
jgi:hypothetical protein